MLGSLKDKMGGGAVQKAIDNFTPEIQAQLNKITSMHPDDIKNDETFKTKIVSPALVAASAASSGATRLIPKFDLKFTNAFLNVRKELVKVNAGSISLVDGYEKRLPDVLMQGFKE